VQLARDSGLSFLAVTDHDTMSGVAEAQAAAATAELEVIPGVEISSEGSWGDLHLLGLYVDAANPHLEERLRAMRESRLGRAQRMVERLTQLGVAIDWEDVQALAGGQSVGRPHVARALVNRGQVSSIEEAFNRYIGREGPAYVPRLRMTPREVIDAIRQAGGVAVLAHPAHSKAVNRVEEFVSYGLQGLEVYYPKHSPDDVSALLDLCQRYNLLATGGSDFHGPHHGEGASLGSVNVPIECVQLLRKVKERHGQHSNSSDA
jgi:hypothetical protein